MCFWKSVKSCWDIEALYTIKYIINIFNIIPQLFNQPFPGLGHRAAGEYPSMHWDRGKKTPWTPFIMIMIMIIIMIMIMIMIIIMITIIC